MVFIKIFKSLDLSLILQGSSRILHGSYEDLSKVFVWISLHENPKDPTGIVYSKIKVISATMVGDS